MFSRDKDLSQIIPFPNKKEQNSFFLKIQNLRNCIAHSDSILRYFENPNEMNKIVVDVQNVITVLRTRK